MDGLPCIADRCCLSEFTFPFSNLGPKKPAGMKTIGQGLPQIKSKVNPMFAPETQDLLAGDPARPYSPYNFEDFEQDIDNIMADNSNPKTFSVHQESVMRQVPYDPSLRIVGSA